MTASKKKTQKRAADKDSTPHSAAVDEAADPARVNVTLRFTLRAETVKGIDAAQVLKWMREAETYARVFEGECPAAAREVFARVFQEHLFDLSELDLAEPNVVRVLYPLALLALQGHAPATSEGVALALESAFEHLTPDPLRTNAYEGARGMYLAQQLAADKAAGG